MKIVGILETFLMGFFRKRLFFGKIRHAVSDCIRGLSKNVLIAEFITYIFINVKFIKHPSYTRIAFFTWIWRMQFCT